MKTMIALMTVVSLSVIFMKGNVSSIDMTDDTAAKSIVLPEIDVALADGSGRDKVASYCSICHSTDYITMQPRLTVDKWSAIVHKMIVVFGAPVNEDDSKTIINYLAEHYGPDK